MRIGFAAIAPLLMLLSGCWESKTPLMPLAARDLLPIDGRYNVLPVGGGEYVLVNLLGDRRYSVTGVSKDRPQQQPSFVSFDEIEQLPAVAPALARTSRIFIAQSEEQEGSNKHIYFGLIIVDRNDDRFLTLRNLPPVCSDAVRLIVGAAAQADCVFDNYAQVQAAAIDAVRWMNDARVRLNSVAYVRPEI